MSFSSSMKYGTPVTAGRNVSVKKMPVRERLTAKTKMGVKMMLCAFNLKQANIIASLQVWHEKSLTLKMLSMRLTFIYFIFCDVYRLW